MRRAGGIALRLLPWAAFLGIAAFLWTVAATYAFLAGTRLTAYYPIPGSWYQWWLYAFTSAGSFSEAQNHAITSWLRVGAFAGLLPNIVYLRVVFWIRTRIKGTAFTNPLFNYRKPIVRGDSDNHGHADWMPMKRAQERFPPTPDPDIGGVVVGEADRMDLGPAAGMRFDRKNPKTWGNGGKAPLLIDRLDGDGPPHSMVIAGSGTYKTAGLVTTVLTWRKSCVVMDPSKKLAQMLARTLRERGKRVICLDVGGNGFNVLKSIDITDPLADTKIRSVVGRIVGPAPGPKADATGNSADFREWGKSIVTALLADMMYDPDIPDDLKTLDNLRAGLCVGQEAMRDVLRDIHAHSHSRMARQLASNMMDLVDQTFSGAYGNATRDTAWLSTKAYADLVSGDEFDASEFCDGNTVIFLQVPLAALSETPAVARVTIASLVETVIADAEATIAAGLDVTKKVLFAIDEAVLLGPMTALKIARDQGRQFGIVLHLLYQSEGQIEEIWGKQGKDTWWDCLGWRAYAGVKAITTSRELSELLGTFPARATSVGQNKGRSGRFMEASSASRGSNTNEHEISRRLCNVSEIMTDFRSDERIVIVGNDYPIRCGAPIGFRRADIADLLDFAPAAREQEEEMMENV